LYFEPPNSVKKKSAKTFLGDTGRVALAFNNNQEQTKITQFSKGSSVKYEITQNDEPLKIHKTRSTQEAIQALFPLTISQYYTTVYLNAVSNNRILMGRGTERMDLFESLFSLEAHASMHEEIKAQYDATLQAQNSKKLFENELDSLGEPADIKKLKFARADLENLADQLRKKHDRLLSKSTKLESLKRLVEGLSKEDLKILPEVSFRLTELKSLVVKQRESLENAVSLKEKWDTYEASLKRQRQLKKTLESFGDVVKSKIDVTLALQKLNYQTIESMSAFISSSAFPPAFEKAIT
jgi:DNA repair exonuclease SbcCD ATPase subunit